MATASSRWTSTSNMTAIWHSRGSRPDLPAPWATRAGVIEEVAVYAVDDDPVGDLAGQFEHARTSCGQVDRRGFDPPAEFGAVGGEILTTEERGARTELPDDLDRFAQHRQRAPRSHGELGGKLVASRTDPHDGTPPGAFRDGRSRTGDECRVAQLDRRDARGQPQGRGLGGNEGLCRIHVAQEVVVGEPHVREARVLCGNRQLGGRVQWLIQPDRQSVLHRCEFSGARLSIGAPAGLAGPTR